MQKRYQFSDGHFLAVIIMFFAIVIFGIKVSEFGFINLTGMPDSSKSINLNISYPGVYTFTFLGKSYASHGAVNCGEIYQGRNQFIYRAGGYSLALPVRIVIIDGRKIALIQQKWHEFLTSKSSLGMLSMVKDKLRGIVMYYQEIMQKLAKQKQKW